LYKFRRADLARIENFEDILVETKPDVVINLASLSSVSACEINPELSMRINLENVVNLVEAIIKFDQYEGRAHRFIQASSSEMYASNSVSMHISENSELAPKSIYGKHKASAHEFIQKIKQANPDSQLKCAILFNHESPRRGDGFVSRKIVKSIHQISVGKLNQLNLGNVYAERDWGYAPNFADALYLQSKETGSEDYVVSTGNTHSIKEFYERTFEAFGISNYSHLVSVDETLIRPVENTGLSGDNKKILKNLGWSPEVYFSELIDILVRAEKSFVG
jgi:GDPmannose 4,6-dehydratase